MPLNSRNETILLNQWKKITGIVSLRVSSSSISFFITYSEYWFGDDGKKLIFYSAVYWMNEMEENEKKKANDKSLANDVDQHENTWFKTRMRMWKYYDLIKATKCKEMSTPSWRSARRIIRIHFVIVRITCILVLSGRLRLPVPLPLPLSTSLTRRFSHFVFNAVPAKRFSSEITFTYNTF